jgi:hypothetical protein
MRLTNLRHDAAGGNDRRSRSLHVCATLLKAKRRLLAAGLIRVYVLALTARDGTVVHSELVALREPMGSRLPTTARPLADMIDMAGNAAFNAELFVPIIFRERIAHLIQQCSRASSALVDRERVVALPISSTARHLVQSSLFDRRAIRASREQKRTTAAVLEDANLRIEALMARAALAPSVRLAAVLLIEDRSRR